MKVLVATPGLQSQADAAASSLRRARAMALGGASISLFGYPEQYPCSAPVEDLPYHSALGRARKGQQARWRWLSEKGGVLWSLIAERFIVQHEALRFGLKEGFDIIVIDQVEPWLLLLSLMLHRPKKAAVFAKMTTSYYSKTSIRGRPLPSRIRTYLNFFSLKPLSRRAHMIADNEHMRRMAGLGDSPRTHIVPEIFQEAGQIPATIEARKKLGLPEEGRVLLHFGVASRMKGSDLLFKALEEVEPDFTLCVVGQTGGIYEASWGNEEGPHAAGWRDRLHVVSRFVTDEEMLDYFAACDAIVLPYRDGFSYASGNMRQAIEFGRAVLASDQYWMGDIVRAYDVGLLFPPEDIEAMREALRAFAAKPQSWFEDIRQNAARVLEDFSPAKTGQLFFNLFEDACKKK